MSEPRETKNVDLSLTANSQ